MFKLNFKIVLRNLWRNKVITMINVGGLSVALASFILMMMYVTYKTSYDKDNPRYHRTYIVGRSLPEFNTNYTSPPLAKAIKDNFPEVEAVGKTRKGGFEFASGVNTVFASNYLMIDYEAVKMLNINPEQGTRSAPEGDKALFYLSKKLVQVLFPHKKDKKPEMVRLGGKTAGQSGEKNLNPNGDVLKIVSSPFVENSTRP